MHALRDGSAPDAADWAVPDLPAARSLLDRLADVVEAGAGSLMVLRATGYAERDISRLEQLYAEAREAEWAEFIADCGKYLVELDKEERIGKYTLAELEEEEQSLDRLRRWYRELRSRDLLGIPATRDAAFDLKQCEERFETYAEHVYAALSQPDATSGGPGVRAADRSAVSGFRPRNWLDRAFLIGIIGKGLNGAAELLGGMLLLFLTPDADPNVAVAWTHGELSEDPNDIIATHLLHTADGLTGPGLLFGGVYLLVHGVIKVVLVTALLLNKLWAYPWMIVALLLFIAYQLYRIVLNPTVGLIGLTIFDIVIVALTWREYQQQRRRRHAETTAPSAAADENAAGPAR